MRRLPNLLYILADDMGYGDVSCLNPASKIRTDHLDRIGREGMRFRDAHASSAVCTPSRYSILTGRYNWRSRLKQGVTLGYDPPLIETGRLTVAGLLREQGYATACFGKWHLGLGWARQGDAPEAVDFSRPVTEGPVALGFDTFFGISASLDMPPYVYIADDRPTAVPDRIVPKNEGMGFWREGPAAPDFRHAEVLPTLTRKAADWIREQAGKETPFFLYYALPAPHTPILPGEFFRGRSGTNAYGDFCLQMDDAVGRLLAELDRCGLAENTIVVFASDNGCSPAARFEELARAGHHPSHVFRGHKADIYEGGHRIPLLVRWPARIRPGGVSDATVCLSDLMATCAEITGARLPADAGEDSVSNLPLWMGSGSGEVRDATVHHSFDGSFSIRKGRWKLELCPGSGGWSPPRPGVECEGLPSFQLYDLQDDVGERRNVATAHSGVVAELRALLVRIIEEGRSTPGPRQPNTGPAQWAQLAWMHEA